MHFLGTVNFQVQQKVHNSLHFLMMLSDFMSDSPGNSRLGWAQKNSQAASLSAPFHMGRSRD